jgi:arylsulfatase A
MEEDPSETTNLYFEQPLVVKRLTKKITKIIEDGRSTSGIPQEYVKENWDLPTWIKS